MKANDSKRKVLVTGGTGYIGSHACLSLHEAGFEPVLIDNLCNSSRRVLPRLQELSGQSFTFYEGDIRDRELLRSIFAAHQPWAVMHFAGLKAVGESVAEPERYHANNVEGTESLLQAMAEAGVQRLVFSSSATVYGDPDLVPIAESAPRRTTNPYGQNKLDIEHMLERLAAADERWRIACLRYFNPAGAHASGRLGEDPNGIPNNLMPYISQVAVGRRPQLDVFGDDYDTPDGTGVRDYIHVMDLVEGHVAALEHLQQANGFIPVNLGTGAGLSVLELRAAFAAASGQDIPYRIQPRRPGDIAASWADPSRAKALLGWQAKRNVRELCADAWRWQHNNPQGYDSE
ncbi:MAG: UDP-glucose 4-epimerase GalE [Xanthomonadales bacterium]|nr:UDP-glucose 4-epimerase GalE [Xanthomonadales bacterium]